MTYPDIHQSSIRSTKSFAALSRRQLHLFARSERTPPSDLDVLVQRQMTLAVLPYLL